MSGQREKALQVTAELQERAKQRYVGPIGLAGTWVVLGYKDRAFAELDRAFKARPGVFSSITKEQSFSSLHSDRSW